MTFRRFLILSASFAMALAAVSCKDKDKDKEFTYNYFSGTPSFSMPLYVEPGQTFVLEPKEVKRTGEDSSTDATGCYWSCSEFNIRDTVRLEGSEGKATFTFTVPDELCAFTLSCNMFADDYYVSSYSCQAIIISTEGENKTLTGIDFPEGAKSFTDSRDSKEYMYINAGGLDWMAENLAFEGAGASFENCPVMDKLFGRYYTWTDASKACPDGWRLPSNKELMDLNNGFLAEGLARSTDPTGQFAAGAGNHMVNAYFNEARLWEYWPNVQICNKSGLSLLPTGYATLMDGAYLFYDSLKYCTFWTADEYGSGQAFYRSIFVKEDYISAGVGDKDLMAMPVRCVRNAE